MAYVPSSPNYVRGVNTFPGTHCFIFETVKANAIIEPLSKQQNLETFTLGVHFNLSSTTENPSIISYYESKEMVMLFTHHGRITNSGQPALGLYDYSDGKKSEC